MTTTPRLEDARPDDPSVRPAGPAATDRSPAPLAVLGRGLVASDLRKSVATVTGMLVVLVVGFSIAAPNEFASVGNFRSIGINSAGFLVLAVGMTFVIASGGLDLSVGSVLVFSGVVGVRAMDAVGGDGLGTALVGLIACLASGAAWGLVNGVLVARVRITPIIVTLGTLGLAFGLTLIVTDGQDLNNVPPSLVSNLGFGQVLGIPALCMVALAVAAAAALLLNTTRFGRHALIIGSNPEAAERFGIPVVRRQAMVYVISGLCAGLAGYMNLALFSSTTVNGHGLDILTAIVAVVIGGTSLAGGVATMFGTTVGVLIPAVFANGFVILGLSSYWQQVATGGLLIAVVYGDQLRRNRRGG